jgi:hypothetical protein
MTQGFLVQPAMESYIVRIYRRPVCVGVAGDAGVTADAVGGVALQADPAAPTNPTDVAAALAGTVQALGDTPTQALTFDSAQALLKGLGLDSG